MTPCCIFKRVISDDLDPMFKIVRCEYTDRNGEKHDLETVGYLTPEDIQEFHRKSLDEFMVAINLPRFADEELANITL